MGKVMVIDLTSSDTEDVEKAPNGSSSSAKQADSGKVVASACNRKAAEEKGNVNGSASKIQQENAIGVRAAATNRVVTYYNFRGEYFIRCESQETVSEPYVGETDGQPETMDASTQTGVPAGISRSRIKYSVNSERKLSLRCNAVPDTGIKTPNGPSK